MDLDARYAFAADVCRKAGQKALGYFRDRSGLQIDQKGAQDSVSEADRDVEKLIREQIASSFPEDGIIGEEFGQTSGRSGLIWVIDPIDGTSNFVNGVPVWCVVLAGVAHGKTQIAVIYDAIHDEAFTALRGHGARLNDKLMTLGADKSIRDGTIAVGFSGRDNPQRVARLVEGILAEGGMLIRNASGAISLAYVASGRYIGFVEEHMNAWDCLAGQLLISEAGGRIEDQDADAMIRDGGRVIGSAAEIFDELRTLALNAWTE